MSMEPSTLRSACFSTNSGSGLGVSDILFTFFSPFFSFLPPQPQPFPFLPPQELPPLFFMFIIPQTIRMKTSEWSMRPLVEGQPVGVAILDPRIDRIKRKVSGFAITKNVRPEIIEVMSFSCCFSPPQPQPQSLKIPIVNL
jgi:hypothetical protein